MKPQGKRVFVVPEDVKVSEYIEVKTEEKPSIGKVFDVGADVTQVKDGDRILFNKHHAHKYTVENQDFLIIEEDSIYAVI